MRKLIVAVAIAASAMAANARSLIHYFDFDTLRDGSLAYAGVDKGTRPADFTFKNNGSASLGYTTGALGSDHAFYSSNKSSIWLGDGSASLGCGTTQGFTISFWCKPSASHEKWSDFFGFRVGGMSYRFEYSTANSSAFTLYSSTEDLLSPDTGEFLYYSGATANTWHHFAIVATPNGTNSIGTCALFINGGKVGDVLLRVAGDLQQINIGTWQREGNGNDRKKGANNTGIDEVAVFDYPATAEQLKWLAKYKPAQPANGPGRAMPICWLLDTASEGTEGSGTGVKATNSGTGTWAAYKWRYADYAKYTAPGALGSIYGFDLNNRCTLRVDSSAADGLGATLGSGMTISFWVKAPNTMTRLWRDLMSFRVGNRYERFEWDVSNPIGFCIYGTNGKAGDPSPRAVTLTANTWQHICMTWNEAESRFDFYRSGERQGHHVPISSYSASEALKSFMIGELSFSETGANRDNGYEANVFLDEVAIFNHSLSPNQIAWLANNIPCLPPLDATNLVRTVTTSGAWAGGLASWTVREWDEVGEAWTNTTRTTIYPTLEDTEVEVAVTLADGVELTNDTFVTPKKLVMTAVGASPSAATLKPAADSRFAPQALEIGEGLQLTVPLYDVKVGGTLTLGAGSKITFDVSNYDGGDVALVTDGIALPAGESDALAHFAVTDNRFAVSLSTDGKTVYAKLDNIAATATWTGAGDGTSLDSAANWECCNSSGTVLPNILPCELTRVIVSGSVPFNVPEGTTIPWQYLRFEADDVSLLQDCDWRGLGDVVTVPPGKTVNLNGHKLYINDFDGEGTFTSGVAGGELHIDVPEGATYENGPATLAGSLKLVKEGLGTFLVTREWHTYAGGTVIDKGILKSGVTGGIARVNRGAIGTNGSTITVNEEGTIDVNGHVEYHDYKLVLNGGTMKNGAAVSLSNWTQWSNVSLGDDSTFELIYGYGLYGASSGATTLDLGGHTLTVNLWQSQNFLLYHTTVKNGTVDVTNGGYLVADRTAVVATNADFRINCALNIKVPFSVRNYEAIYPYNYNQGTAAMNVYGVFKPVTNFYYGCTMQNGSTMDLRAWPVDSGWPMYSRFTGGKKDIGFASGTAEAPSIVNVNLAGRTDLNAVRKSENPYVVTWSSQPANVNFVLDAQSRANGYRIYSEPEGLRLKRFTGFMILVK